MAKKKPNKEAETSEKAEVFEEVRDSKNGVGLLNGLEETVLVIPELRDEIKRNKLEYVPAFQAAQKALSVSRQNIEALGKKYKDSLPLDEERGVRTYDDGEVHFEIVEADTISFSVVKQETE